MNISNYRDGKKELLTIAKKGSAMGTCATLNRKYLCCNVQVLKSVQNCPFECSYCFLQNYLNDGPTKAVSDLNALMGEVKENIAKEPARLFRIGTWELGDSLALEKNTGQAKKLIAEFSKLTNSVLELKTKSDSVDSILNIEHNSRTVISWSLNTARIINTEEHFTSSLEKRLDAMNKAQSAGYLIGLHFDPMIYHEGWEDGYKSLARNIFSNIMPERIAWISMGSLRFNPEMKKKIENNYPHSRITFAEMVLGDDSKIRYVKPLRVRMYQLLHSELMKYCNSANLMYLCMERWDVWEKVLGFRHDSVEHLDYIFAKSLYDRFGIGSEKPRRETYEKQ